MFLFVYISKSEPQFVLILLFIFCNLRLAVLVKVVLIKKKSVCQNKKKHVNDGPFIDTLFRLTGLLRKYPHEVKEV